MKVMLVFGFQSVEGLSLGVGTEESLHLTNGDIIVRNDGVCARVSVAFAKLQDEFFTKSGW